MLRAPWLNATDRRSNLIIVPNPPTGPQVETFCRSLPADAVVVIEVGTWRGWKASESADAYLQEN